MSKGTIAREPAFEDVFDPAAFSRRIAAARVEREKAIARRQALSEGAPQLHRRELAEQPPPAPGPASSEPLVAPPRSIRSGVARGGRTGRVAIVLCVVVGLAAATAAVSPDRLARVVSPFWRSGTIDPLQAPPASVPLPQASILPSLRLAPLGIDPPAVLPDAAAAAPPARPPEIPSASLATVEAAAAPPDVPPAAPKPSGALPSEIKLHVSSGVTKRTARRVETALREAGVQDVEAVRVRVRIGATHVRFFHAADAAAAARVAAVLSSVDPASVRDFTHYAPSPAAGWLEIWLSGESTRPAPSGPSADAPTSAPVETSTGARDPGASVARAARRERRQADAVIPAAATVEGAEPEREASAPRHAAPVASARSAPARSAPARPAEAAGRAAASGASDVPTPAAASGGTGPGVAAGAPEGDKSAGPGLGRDKGKDKGSALSGSGSGVDAKGGSRGSSNKGGSGNKGGNSGKGGGSDKGGKSSKK